MTNTHGLIVSASEQLAECRQALGVEEFRLADYDAMLPLSDRIYTFWDGRGGAGHPVALGPTLAIAFLARLQRDTLRIAMDALYARESVPLE